METVDKAEGVPASIAKAEDYAASNQSNSVSAKLQQKGRVLRQRNGENKKNALKKKKSRRPACLSSTSSRSSSGSLGALPTKAFLPVAPRHPENVGYIRKIQIGSFLIDAWYLAPYPEEYSSLEVLYICEFCLKYMKSSYIAKRHKVNTDTYITFHTLGKQNKLICNVLDQMSYKTPAWR